LISIDSIVFLCGRFVLRLFRFKRRELVVMFPLVLNTCVKEGWMEERKKNNFLGEKMRVLYDALLWPLRCQYIVMAPKGEFLVTTDQTIFFLFVIMIRGMRIYVRMKKEKKKKKKRCFSVLSFFLFFFPGPTWSVLGDLTWPTESRRSQMGTRWKRPAGLASPLPSISSGDLWWATTTTKVEADTVTISHIKKGNPSSATEISVCVCVY